MKSDLRKLSLDICEGFSEVKFQKKTLYFKHLGENEQIKLDEYENAWKNKILKLGAPTRDQKLKIADIEKIWTSDQEQVFQRQQKEFLRFYNNKPKFNSIRHIDGFFDTVEDMKRELIVLGMPRNQAIGNCAEENAAFETYNQEIYESCFADKELTIPFFEDYDDIEEKEALELHSLYYEKISSLKTDGFKKIKQICCQEFFYNKFWITDNAFFFLNKPLWKLTILQSYLLSLGKRYTEVLKYCQNAPERYYDEPDKLECYALMVQSHGEDSGDSSRDMINQVKKARRE